MKLTHIYGFTSVNDINAELISKAAKLKLLMELDSLVDDYANVKVKANNVTLTNLHSVS